MINKKEDLYGTEFAITSKEEAQALQDLCDSLGIKSGDWPGCKYDSGVMRGLVSFDLGTVYSCMLIFTSKLPDSDTMEEFKLLRKTDISEILKEPKRTKVEHVKCKFNHAWEAVKEHEESKNIFHCQESGEYAICGYDMHIIGECVRDGEIYRRIETPIEWWEDANDLLGELANLSLDDDGVLQLTMEKGQVGFGMSRDKWCDFARILLEQGE